MTDPLKEILVPVSSALGGGKPLLSCGARAHILYLCEASVQVCPYDLRDSQKFVCQRSSIGSQFADATVWLAIATALAVFRVSKVVEDGVEVTPEGKCTDTFIRYVGRPFVLLLALR